jgi:type IV pilus assembly protein PilA
MLYLYCKQGKGGRKMKSNKGFTLIELLAVIVILAIIALIATPTILGVIETARKGSAESSALGYIDAVEKQIAIDMLETTENDRVFKEIVAGTATSITVSDTLNKSDKFSVKGQKPEIGSTLTYDTEKGIITEACLLFKLNSKDYYVNYTSTKTNDQEAGTAKAGTDNDAPCTISAPASSGSETNASEAGA